MQNELKIRDLSLRDGQQSLFATRMTQEQVDRVLPLFKEVGFYAMEVWGGAVPDSVMRYLNENPWDRLDSIKKGIGNSSKLTALSRGRNLFGYNPYPDEVIEGFNRNAIQSGIDIMRIFDALNDTSNMESTIKYVKENGGLADCAVCFTVDPTFTFKTKLSSFFNGKKIPQKIFTVDYFVDKAVSLEKLGADMITVKDMAGLIPPKMSGELTRELKRRTSIPIDFHTHSTPGYGLASVLMAILNGVDIVDTNILPFSGGPAAPSVEIIKLFCDKLGIKLNLNLEKIKEIDKELRVIRKELSEFDKAQIIPREFDITNPNLPAEIEKLFDDSIKFAKEDNEEELLNATQAIEKWFNLPEPNENVKDAEIPGGMYTNMLTQLKTLKVDHLLDTVLKTVPIVRLDSGCPPLVTPTSQIVGSQAVNYVLDKANDKPVYSNVSTQFKNLVQGQYGKTPIEIDPEFREKITGSPEEIPYDTSNYKKHENPILPECEDLHLAENEREELLLELFPTVAKTYLENAKMELCAKKRAEKEERERKDYEKRRADYENLSDEEKEKLLQEGLYNYDWLLQRDGEK
jgi:pyruvate/oxaloacetate carboxyltransferase